MMRKTMILVCLLLSLIWGYAMAENDTPPAEILNAMRESYGDSAQYADYIQFTLNDGTKQSFLLFQSSNVMGFVCSNHGEWQMNSSGGMMDNHIATGFVRHQTTQLRPDGTSYPDELGYDILCATEGTVLSYHFDGEAFSVCGWTDPERYDGSVMIRGTTLEYYPRGTNVPEAVVDAGDRLDAWVNDFEHHPATPAEAEARAAISEQAVSDFFPEYDLRHYSDYNAATGANASYSKIENGMLYFKFVTFEQGRGVVREINALPVPLSASLMKRLETEPFDSLISPYYGGSRFRADDAIDTHWLPVTGKILDVDNQSKAIVFLTEDEQKNRYVQVVVMNDQGEYRLSVQTPALPSDTGLDLFHRDDGEISLEWSEQRGQAGYRLHADGRWLLEWCMRSSEKASMNYAPHYFGVTVESGWSGHENSPLYVGTWQGFDLSRVDLNAFPSSRGELLAVLDSTDWAVVNNPNPADRLHLRTKPDRKSESYGKFYNGTPVKILAQKGAWSQVEIGLHGLTGWMMTEYLALGKEAATVYLAFPDLMYREEYDPMQPAFTDKSCKQKVELSGSCRIVGVVEDELYILLTDLGEVGYVPKDWLWAGNG